MINYLHKLGFSKYTEIQTKLLKLKNANKNILAVSSTGSGKTEGGYNCILNTYKKNTFILPMRTLADSIYDRLNIYNMKLNLPKWTIQHSTNANDKFLDNKYCVTTIDQVLTGWLGMGTQSFIRGKNVVTSNLIFDEVQLFEPDKTFLTTINMLDSIYNQGTNNFMIMTATMPSYLINFLKNRYDMEVIICDEESVQNREVKIKYVDNLDFDMINKYKQKQLIICNSQSQQEYVLSNIKNKKRCIMINNKLLFSDRQKVEKLLYKYFGKQSEDNNKILITTQIVEAGIDISANIVYSISSPIDNLVQRAGRCCRWGGDGEFIVFDIDDISNSIYDKNIATETIDIIKENQDIVFSWDLQKKWINQILNPFYEKYINRKEILRNKQKILNNKRSELIRDIRNINIIVKDTSQGVNKEMFNYESVSIDINKLRQLNENEIYILNNNQIKLVKNNEVDVGDTIIINNKNCIYDKLGFRIRQGEICKPFNNKLKLNKNQITYNDYKLESWESHFNLTKNVFRDKLSKYTNIEYIKENIDKISLIGGLHDLGKLDVKWCEWAGNNTIPVAHFPNTKKMYTYKNRKHNHISAVVLKEYCDNILFNMVIQHHKRIVCVDSELYIEEYQLHKLSNELVKLNDIKLHNKNIHIERNEIMNPTNKDWNTFLILTGLLMESDIEAINQYIDNYTQKAS